MLFDHVISACGDLKSRCHHCSLRGHRAVHCRDERRSQEELISTFELYADLSNDCSKRYTRPEWGVYPVVNAEYYDRATTVRYAFPITYSELIRLPVDKAFDVVVLFNRAVRRRMKVIDPDVPRGLSFTAPFDYE